MEEKITIYYCKNNNTYTFIKNKMSFFEIIDKEYNFELHDKHHFKEKWFEDSPVCRKIEDYELIFSLIDYLFFNESKEIIYDYDINGLIDKEKYDNLKEYFVKYRKQFLSNL